MIRSKATAALLRLKEIDKKYKARYEDQKQEKSSDNTESLLVQDEYKNNILPSLVREKQEILKPTLNIKIPDTCIEQLDSVSTTSDKASSSLRVSIVDKTPIATPTVESQSVSDIQEELDDTESIAEELEDFNHSDSEVTMRSREERVEGPKSEDASLAIRVESISTEKKQLNSHESISKDVDANDYSHDSFDTYSSVAKNSSSTHSLEKESNSKIVSPKSNSHERNYNISTLNTEKDDVLSESGGILDAAKLAESLEKGNKIVTPKDTRTTDERDEIAEALSMSVKATDSSRSKLDPKTTFKVIPGKSERTADSPHGKLNLNNIERKNSKITERGNQEESSSIEDNSSDKKLRRNESKQKDLEIKDKRENGEELSFKGTNSSREKSERNQSKRKVSKITCELENEEEFSCLKNEKSPSAKSEQKKNKRKDSTIGNREKSEISSSSFEVTNSSSVKSGRYRSRSKNLGPTDKTENDEELSSSAKEAHSLLKKIDNNETASFISAHTTKQTLLQSLRRSKKHRRKSSDYSEGVGIVPEADAVESESSSRRISSRGRTEHRSVGFEEREVKKGSSRTVDRTLRKSQSAIEIGATRKRENPTIMRRKSHYQRAKVYEHIESKKNGANTSKHLTSYRVNEKEYERKDRELERLKMRMCDLRLEQERRLMLCYMKDFEEDRESLVLWPNRFYCSGKPEVSVIKPLNFPNVLNFTKPDSTPVERGLIRPDNHSTMLKNRVVEIRQWLKDQFILYRDYSDVAAAINAKYVAEAGAEKDYME